MSLHSNAVDRVSMELIDDANLQSHWVLEEGKQVVGEHEAHGDRSFNSDRWRTSEIISLQQLQ